MRPSKREVVLDAARTVVERDGVAALTYESLAAQSGLSKGGLLYHFPTREALLIALHEHVVSRWEQELERTAGKPGQDASPTERIEAYVRTAPDHPRAELLLLLDDAGVGQAEALWDAVLSRWAGRTPSATATDAELRRFIARLAADGLWLHRALGWEALPEALTERVLALIGDLHRNG